jgi:hypothetical protein
LATQKREAGRQVNRFDVRYGTLRATTILAEIADDVPGMQVEVRAAGRALRASIARDSQSIRVRLEEPVVLQAGETLEVVLR